MTNIELYLTIGCMIFVGAPSLLIFVELCLGQKKLRSKGLCQDSRKPCVILIPAHNEELVIEDTLIKLKQEIQLGDRVVVVADNCSDNTVLICKKLKVEVIERSSDDKRGKGFALDFGVRYIENDMSETVVMLDADCEFEPGSLGVLVSRSQTYKAVVQSMYLMQSPVGAAIKTRIAEFAWLVKNRIRPTGLARMALN